MQQAGVNNITLYENKGLKTLYNIEGNIESITTTGQTLTINNYSQIKFKIEPQRDRNNTLVYNYILDYLLYDLTIVNINQVLDIKRSIYGFMPEIYYNNGDRVFINIPLIFEKNETPNNSNHFKISIQNRIPTKQKPITVSPIEGEGIGFWIIENTFIVQ